MGEVYLARHPRLPRRDAIKVLAPEISADPGFRKRFNREAELASTLYHPHIVGVHDRGECDGRLWLSMDYVEGSDAARLLNTTYPNGLPVTRVIEIVTAVASALDYAHERGLLHRDVKPANILVAEDLSQQRIILADFGIARSIDSDNSLTATNVIVGTLAYSAPEQLLGRQLDGRADQYALAATAYHLLTGSQLFRQANAAAMISQHLSANPPALAEVRSELAVLDSALARALSKEPDNRFSSCGAFAEALRNQSALHQTRKAVRPTSRTLALEPSGGAEISALGDSNNAATSLRVPILLGLLIAITLVCIVIVANRSSPPSQVADDTVSYSTTAPTTLTTATTPTFNEMRDFITNYYDLLPTRAADAWAFLDTPYQAETGLDSYIEFWSTISAVDVVSVRPLDSTSIIARIRYTQLSGQNETEDRWFSLAGTGQSMTIEDSERIGAAPR